MTARATRLAIAVVTAVAALGCQGSRPLADERRYRAAHGKGDLLIGAGWPWAARRSLLYGEGIDLAVSEINGAGGTHGRRLRIVREDDKESVDEGRMVAQRFATNPDIVAVIGHLHSYVTNPAAAIYDAAGLLMIVPTSTDPDLTRRGYTRLFRTIFTDTDVGRQMAHVAAAQGHQRVAIYYIRTAYGRGLANAFEETAVEHGIKVVDRQSYDPNQAVSRDVVDRVLDDWTARDLSAVFIAGEAAQTATLTARMRARGVSIPILAGDAAGTSELFGLGAEPVEGTIVASAFHPQEPRPEVHRFVEAFERRYHQKPDAAAALGYDAVRLLAWAISEARSADPHRVASALHAAKDWPGVTGSFRFTDAGDLIDRSFVTMIAHQGGFEYFTAARPRRADAANGAGR